MTGIWSFMCYELRRHLPTLAVGSALLVIVPAVSRLGEGRWNYWNGEWNVAGAAFAAFGIAPLLAFWMAISGWAGERAAGALEWLYSRPLSTAQIFWSRLAVVVGATVAWTAAAFLANGVFPWKLFSWAVGPGFRAGLLWLVLIGFVVAGGLMASALCRSPGTAFRGFLVGLLAVAVLVPFLLLLLAPTTTALLVGGGRLLSVAGQLYGGVMALALVVGAWVAMRRSPGDARRLPRALGAAGAVAVVAVAALVVSVLQSLRVDSARVRQVRWLGDGTTLELSLAPGIADPLCHPVVRHGDGSERVLRRSFVFMHPVFAHAGRGLAILVKPGIPWWRWYLPPGRLIVDRQGEVRSFELPRRVWPEPIGWSCRGSYFAWRTRISGFGSNLVSRGLIILDEDLRLDMRSVRTPSSNWTAAWIDDEQLLLTPAWGYRGFYGEQEWWWMVISADGEVRVEPQYLPEGTFLLPVGVGFPRDPYSKVGDPSRHPMPLPLCSREPVLILSNERDGARLAHLDLRRGELRLGPAIAWPPFRFGHRRSMIFLASFGTLADGSLLWAEPMSARQARIMRMRPPAVEKPAEVCTVEDLIFRRGARYYGATGSWALWADADEARLFACHLDTGEVRVLENLGPLGVQSADVVEGGVLTTEGKIPLD